jgi:hypothetical protein
MSNRKVIDIFLRKKFEKQYVEAFGPYSRCVLHRKLCTTRFGIFELHMYDEQLSLMLWLTKGNA